MPLFNHLSDQPIELIKLFMQGKPVSNHENMKSSLRQWVGDMTFAEIYE